MAFLGSLLANKSLSEKRDGMVDERERERE